jgi:hypothetical protein
MPPLKAPEMGPWIWFTEKILPSLFLAVTISFVTASFAIYQSVSELTNSVKLHDQRLNKLEAKIENSVTRGDLLETLKRVEQQLQIVLLQSGIKTKVEIMTPLLQRSLLSLKDFEKLLLHQVVRGSV